MLNIYMGKENLPPGKKLIWDAETYWPIVGIPDNFGSRYILAEFEGVEYYSTSCFKTKDGKILDGFKLSTGTKILLEVFNSGDVINGLELGINAFEFMITHLTGNVYFNNVKRFRLPKYYPLENISVNGVVFERELDLENALWKK